MAIWSQAQDINTRETIWVAQHRLFRRPQLNSHNSDCYARDGIDGFNSAELAGLHTDYVGNGWQAKYMDHIAKWSKVACA